MIPFKKGGSIEMELMMTIKEADRLAVMRREPNNSFDAGGKGIGALLPTNKARLETV